MTEWKRVVFAADCDEDGNCPRCGIDYADCGCPGPTQDGYEYKTAKDGVLYAREIVRRQKPTRTEQLAAALLALGDIPFDDARLMTAKQIIGLYQFDHWPIRVEAGGDNHPSNLRPLLIKPHRKKTAEDNAEIGKIRRTRRAQDEHDQRMRAKIRGEQERRIKGVLIDYPKRRWPSRPFPKRKKKSDVVTVS